MEVTNEIVIGRDDWVYSEHCIICGERAWSWTDLHGQATCARCGTPYLTLLYDLDDRWIAGALRLLAVRGDLIPVLQRYWYEIGKDNGLGVNVSDPRRAALRAEFDKWLEETTWFEEVYLAEREEATQAGR